MTGLYQYGVAEPIFYYRGYGNTLFKTPWQNDDQFAQQALFVTLYHWGLHAWGCYILVALTLGVVAHRWDMPMTLRMAFYPLLGGDISCSMKFPLVAIISCVGMRVMLLCSLSS